MTTLLTGTIMLSLLHGLIPSHWLPVLALKERFGWQGSKTVRIASVAALAHSLSTFLLGVFLGLFSLSLAGTLNSYTRWVIPALLIAIGFYFIIQHHRHHHFHFNEKQKLDQAGATQVVTLLVFMMFLSPCLEIEAYFLIAGLALHHRFRVRDHLLGVPRTERPSPVQLAQAGTQCRTGFR